MATTTATITLSSSDISDNSLSISNTATLTNQGTDTGMTKTTGLTRIITKATSNVILINTGDTSGNYGAAALGDDNTINKGKIFIQNLNDRGDGSKYVTVLMQAVVIGRLYGGDFAYFPFQGTAGGDDIEITPNSTTETTLEYIVFYE
mgnify:FL=1|tara:strand:+ start:19 stop:462 length:444 start_codon:yes stop_codon:yes gene_type:complete